MKEVYKTLALLVCWSIAAVAYASAACTIGDIRLIREEHNATATTGELEVCVSRTWTTVCSTGGWHSDSLNGTSNNTRVACRQLGYREEGATFTRTQGSHTTFQGLRQEMCSGSEQKLIDCPDLRWYGRCAVGTNLTCAVCTIGDIRLSSEVRNATATTGRLEVRVSGNWTTVCNTGGWHSTSLNGTSNNTRVACRQLGYREEGATFTNTQGIPTTPQGLRQEMCSGSEQKLIDCPPQTNSDMCGVGTNLTCVTCGTTIRLRGGRTATEGRVEVCRDGQWGTVCDDSWDTNDASVACTHLGLSNFNAVAVPTAHFGAGSGEIYFSNPQCNGSEAALTDCTFDTTHQCSHNRDVSVICLPFNASIDIVHIVPECANGTFRVVYDLGAKEVQLCSNQTWNMCGSICQNGVMQLGAYFCGSGEITHFLLNGSKLYECPISGAGELFLICEPTTVILANSCQQVLQDIELQATSSSITVTWGNGENFDNSSKFAEYEITCSLETSNLQASIILVEPTTSEVTMDNLPHSTTYECCVTLHIGRYSIRACSNTATLAQRDLQNDSTAIQGVGLWAVIALGVLVAVLVLLLVLATGAWLYSRNKIPALNSTLNDGTTQLSQDPCYALPTSGSKPAKSGTEAEYEVVDREQPDGAELKLNPAYSVHKTHPQQTNTDTTVYETVDL